MNKKTYEALKELIKYLELLREAGVFNIKVEIELNRVRGWIDEVAKEYED
jgi:hypothetical protein